jgi:hypothetical protein
MSLKLTGDGTGQNNDGAGGLPAMPRAAVVCGEGWAKEDVAAEEASRLKSGSWVIKVLGMRAAVGSLIWAEDASSTGSMNCRRR